MNDNPNTYIRVWRYRDAPTKYKLSTNGGDEDWCAFVPNNFGAGDLHFLDEGTPFGCCSVEEHEVIGGTVLIGCHS